MPLIRRSNPLVGPLESLVAAILSFPKSWSPVLSDSLSTPQAFPGEVFQLQELVCLRMRNNPIRDIPNGEHYTAWIEDTFHGPNTC